MGFYIQDDMWQAVADAPKSVQDAYFGALARLWFSGEETQLKGHAKVAYTLSHDRVLLSKVKSDKWASKRLSKSLSKSLSTEDETDFQSHFQSDDETDFQPREKKKEKENKNTFTTVKVSRARVSGGEVYDEEWFDKYK